MNPDANVIIKCLGKTLKTNVKFLSMVKIKFFDSNDHDITSDITGEKNEYAKGYSEVMICLGEDMIFLMKKDMSKIIEKFYYKNIYEPVMEANPDVFHLKIYSYEEIIKHKSIHKITISSKIRNSLFKSLMCYYTVYGMHKSKIIKSLIPTWKTKGDSESKKLAAKEKEGRQNTKYNQRIIKNYIFYIKGSIKKGRLNDSFQITYCKDKKGEDKNKMVIEEDNQHPSKGCELLVDISQVFPIGRFDKNKDDRDIAYFAYTNALNYLKFTIKANVFWITKNEIYYKKLNMTEDMTQWDGWKIEVRIIEPELKNIIFIFLRRKFIPPYFDCYQDFLFLLTEDLSLQNIDINPEAYQVIHLAANSIYHPDNPPVKDSRIFLEAKIDSLLVDEETLYFYQSVFNIYGTEMLQFGFDLLHNICQYFNTTNVKDHLEVVNVSLKKKKNTLMIKTNKWSFEGRIHEFMKKVNQMILDVTEKAQGTREIKGDEGEGECDAKTKQNEVEMKNTTPGGMTDDPLDLNNEISPNGGTSGRYTGKKREEQIRFNKIWSGKLMRFIAYCLDGGLTDNKMKYSTFIKEVLEACQNTNHDIHDLVYSSINIADYEATSYKDSLVQGKSIVAAITNSSKITYNENAMCNCINSNFLSKYIDVGANKFIAILLASSCTNKLLKAIFDNLRKGESNEGCGDKRDMIVLISPLREIFEDEKRSPYTLLLAGKCLCLLVKNETEGLHRIKLADEGNVVEKIKRYLTEYEYDEKLVLCCMDMFGYIMNHVRDRLQIILYSNPPGTGLMDVFFNFFQRPKIPGLYYSQRVMNKVLTILLPLTSVLESEMRDKFNLDDYKKIYPCIVNLLKPEERSTIIDPSEEDSTILEYKIYWLMTVLLCQNEIAQNYIWNELQIIDIIESNSLKYITQMKVFLELKDQVADNDGKCLCKKIYKFCELVYYLIFGQEDRIRTCSQEAKKFNELRLYVEDRMKDFLTPNDVKSDVFNMINKLYKRCQNTWD